MRSYRTPEQVTADLGDKVMESLGRMVSRARTDLLKYRRQNPTWVAAHSERALANWIHDREWDHLVNLVSDMPGIYIKDAEPIREICINDNYYLRIKRHHWDGRVSSYPTSAATLFMTQPIQDTLDGLEEIHLLAGYSWDKATREILNPVLSLRDGVRRPIWYIDITEKPDDGAADVSPFPMAPVPAPPTIDTSKLRRKDNEETPQ